MRFSMAFFAVSSMVLSVMANPPKDLQSLRDQERLTRRIPAIHAENAFQLGQSLEALGSPKSAWFAYDRASKSGHAMAEARKNQLGSTAPVTHPHVLIIAPWTGAQQFLGEEARKGIELALSAGAWNSAKTGIVRVDANVPLSELFFRLEDLADSLTLVGVVGPLTSQNSAAVLSWFEARFPGLPMVQPTATDSLLTRMGKGVIQLNRSPLEQADSIVQFAKCRGLQRILVVPPKNEYGTGMAEQFRLRAQSVGLKVEVLSAYPERTVDYTSIVKQWKIKESNWDAIFNPASTAEEAASFVRQMRYHRIRLPILGSGGWAGLGFPDFAGQEAEGNFMVSPSLDWRGQIDFAKTYRQKFGRLGEDRVAALTYDALLLLNQYLEKGNWDGLKQTTLPSATGALRIDSLGVNRSLSVAQWKSGQWNRVGCSNK
jgi:ABC-type branched-subunit amino acid transport system substrate-binding protein